jgi:hypothetical protein
MLQLREDGALCPRMPPAQAKNGPAPRASHANYTTVDEILMEKEVLAGTFFLNEHPIIILFDSRALHDFMSST